MTCYLGDCRDGMREMIADGVRAQMCVTSPPYFGLRDYGMAAWDGGDAECDHVGPPMRTNNKPSDPTATFHGGASRGNEPWRRGICGKCGARRVDQQIGLEATPDAYVASMVEVFRLVRELLEDDGVAFVNLGDSYLPNKCEALIPHRVYMALIDNGWTGRQTIIWSKPNSMPESVTDRCTKAHEYLFLLTKRPTYYFDAAAIAEPLTCEAHAPGNLALAGGKTDSGHLDDRIWGTSGFRNKRSVWTVASQPFADAHFATFPPKLIEPCILAGSRVGDVVFDPFMGSGTTGQVAQQLGRRWLGCELNPAYVTMQQQRTAQQGIAFA